MGKGSHHWGVPENPTDNNRRRSYLVLLNLATGDFGKGNMKETD